MNGPVILCGVGNVGRRVLECLLGDGVPVVAIDQKDKSALPEGVKVVIGDCRDRNTLIAAGVQSARGVIVCTSDDLINLATVLTVRGLAPSVRVVVRTFNPDLIPRLGNAVGNVAALSVSALAAPLLALIAQTGTTLGEVAAIDGVRSVSEIDVTAHSPLLGRTIDSIAASMLVLAFTRPGQPTRFLADVPLDTQLKECDQIVVCGKAAAISEFSSTQRTGNDIRWAGWLRRVGRVMTRAWHEIDWPVKVCTLALFLVVLGSALVYRWVNHDSPAIAFYHTVSVLATGADLHAEAMPPGMKAFVSALRLAGAALLACFTAILTNYLVRARLGRALEVRRIPDSGHVVVCGLGNVGVRIVTALRKAGQAVVVIEPVRDGRFLASARRLGAAIVVGDATAADVLRQARVATAHAIVAVTSSDLVNVETALLVRELAPEKRVVLRLGDADLARALREAANVRFAISVPVLAAPAFVAALYGDRVQSVFLVGGKMLVAVDLTIEADEPGLAGELVGSLTGTFGLLSVALSNAKGQPIAEMHEHRLAAGDRLTAIAALTDLDRIYRRGAK